MKTFEIRPYHGHDCNSHDGLNNGHYLDNITVQATDENDAIDKAMDKWASENKLGKNVERDPSHMENCFYHAFAFTDRDGNDIDRDDYDDDKGHGYLYEFINFSEVMEVTE